MINLEVIVPTVNRTREGCIDLLKTLKISSRVIIANQVSNQNLAQEKENIGPEQQVIFSQGKGVSLNRNTAIACSSADILLFIDDDCRLVPDYQTIVASFFDKHPEVDAVKFAGQFLNKPRSKDRWGTKRAHWKQVSRTGAPGLAIKRSSLVKFHLKFCEKLGAPNYIYKGEDSLFLRQLLRKKAILWTNNMLIYELLADKEENSTYFKGYDQRFFVSQGADLKLIYRCYWSRLFLKTFYWSRKTKQPFLTVYRWMISGTKLVKRSDYND
jgi:glycosyltransferase involved in cell wall biosynthesis